MELVYLLELSPEETWSLISVQKQKGTVGREFSDLKGSKKNKVTLGGHVNQCKSKIDSEDFQKKG